MVNQRATHHNLLSFGEVVRWVLVQLHYTNFLQRRQLFWDDLGRVKHIEAERKCLILINDLDSELPLGIVARRDGVEQVGTVRISIFASKGLGLLPIEAGLALFRLPVPFDKL